MKKFLAILLAIAMSAVLFAGCTTEPATPDGNETPDGEQTGDGTYELAMITDLGTIDDKSFNQGTWEGLKKYADDNNITSKYYKPTEQSNDAYLAAIQLAVDGGAKVIATPGFLFEVPIFIAQDLYPDVNFILIDGNPNDGDWSNGAPVFRSEKNVVGITYAEEQSGFLAGYAAVKDGYTKLGFMGGMAVPAVIRFGYGFVQGADYAAKEMGITGIEVKYHYTGGFDATPEAQSLAASWYNSGTEVIFGCGGSVGNSVFAAAEANNGKAIGVDVDQSNESDTIITSAMKGLGVSVYQTLEAYYKGEFPGGQSVIKDASNEGVGLPMETSKFNTFSQADYDAIYAKLVDGSVTLAKDTNVATVNEVPVTVTTVTLVD